MGINEPDIFNEACYEFITQKEGKYSYEDEIARLPYVFSDPHALDKKIDPRKRKFGSRIENGDGGNGVEYFTMKRVLEPNLIQLHDGTLVRLLGIVPNSKTKEKAIAYLNSKLKGQRIFLRSDEPAEDDQGNKLAYVYLKNKTFINAHLVRTGLVHVDEKMKYKYKKKFL